MASIEERLDIMEAKIKEPKFRDTTGKANEVNYWVFDYAPENELIVRDRIEYLKNKNSRGTDGFELVVYDLYDLIIAHLEDKNFMEKCYQMEEKRGIVKVASAIQRSLKITDKDNMIVEYIAEHTPENSVVFLTGVGKCYPLLQSPEVFNKILYNMPQHFAKVPMCCSIREPIPNRNSSYSTKFTKIIITGHSGWYDNSVKHDASHGKTQNSVFLRTDERKGM